MIGYRFMNDMLQHMQDKTWRTWGEQCPYNLGDLRRKQKLEFVADHWFDRYNDLGYKAYRLYWRLHPDARKHY